MYSCRETSVRQPNPALPQFHTRLSHTESRKRNFGASNVNYWPNDFDEECYSIFRKPLGFSLVSLIADPLLPSDVTAKTTAVKQMPKPELRVRCGRRHFVSTGVVAHGNPTAFLRVVMLSYSITDDVTTQGNLWLHSSLVTSRFSSQFFQVSGPKTPRFRIVFVDSQRSKV